MFIMGNFNIDPSSCDNEKFGGCGSVLSIHNDPRISQPPFPITKGICRKQGQVYPITI